MRRVIFDIETIGSDFDSLDAESQEYLLKFAKSAEEIELEKEKLPLYPLTGEVISIGLLNPDTGKGRVYFRADKRTVEPFEEEGIEYISDTEEGILKRFWKDMAKYDQFITFNGRRFDCPFLLLRSMKLGIEAGRNIMPYRYSHDVHIDLLDQLTFHGSIRKFSLDFYCKSFGIESPKSKGITGHDMSQLFKNQEYEKIARYCSWDLKATGELFEKWEQSISF